MKIVGPILRNRQYLRAGVSAKLGRIIVGDHAHFLDGLLIGCYDCRAAMRQAVDARTINLETVGGNALAIGRNLWLIFNLKNETIGCRTARARKVRQIYRAAASSARGIAKYSRHGTN